MAVNPSEASVALVELVTEIVIANPDTELDGEFLAASLGIKSQKEVTSAVDVLRRVFDMQQAHSSGRRRIQKAGAVWVAYSKIHERDGVFYRCGVGEYVFDTDALPMELAEINGVPAKVLRSKAEIAKIREGRKQQMAMQQMLEAAPVAADAAKSLAEAAATASSVPAALPGMT